MKKQYYFVALLIIFPFLGNAQLSGAGLSGGGSFSTFDYTGDSQTSLDNGTKSGATGGIRLDFDLGSGDVLKFSPELFFVQNGSKDYYSSLGMLVNDLRSVTLNYIGLYLPLTVYLPLGGDEFYDKYHGVMIQARVFTDYAINGTIQGGYGGSVDFGDLLDRFDLGYSFEAGFAYEGLNIMLGYNKGIKDIEFNDSIASGSEGQSIINNRGLTLQIGYIGKIE